MVEVIKMKSLFFGKFAETRSVTDGRPRSQRVEDGQACEATGPSQYLAQVGASALRGARERPNNRQPLPELSNHTVRTKQSHSAGRSPTNHHNPTSLENCTKQRADGCIWEWHCKGL